MSKIKRINPVVMIIVFLPCAVACSQDSMTENDGNEVMVVPEFDLNTACGTKDYMAFLIKNELEITTKDTDATETLKEYARYSYLLPGRSIRWVWNSLQC